MIFLMSPKAVRELTRLVVCLLGGTLLGVGLLELLIALDVVTVFDQLPDVAAGVAGMGIGLLRYGGPSRNPEGG